MYLAFKIVQNMVKKPKNPGIRKKWKPEALDKAMEAVKKEKLTIRQAADKFEVSLYWWCMHTFTVFVVVFLI